jgi:hypothetical protein
VIDAFMPLVLSRLKYYGAAGNEDAKQAALVGLLTALRNYDPAVDASVGTFASLYRHIDDAIKYEIRGKEGDAWDQNNVDGGQQLYDDEGEGSGDRWGVMPTTHLPDAIANGIDRALDAQNRLHRNRIPDWVQMWAAETRIRQGFGAREEGWMDLPATPQEMAEALAKIPADKVGRALGKLNEREREIVVARFYRKPPILLGEIARGALNPKSKVSYKETLKIAYRAVVKIAGQFEVKRPTRRPMRQPDPPRQLPFRPWHPLTPLEEIRRWLKWYEIRRWPFLDSRTLTVHSTRVTKREAEKIKRLDNAPILVAVIARQKIKYRDNIFWGAMFRYAPPPFRIWFNGKVRVRTITIVYETHDRRFNADPQIISDSD